MPTLPLPERPPRFDDVVLRPFQEGDVEMLCELATDPYVPLIGSLPANACREDAEEYITRQHARRETGVGYSFCVAGRDNRAVGTAGLWLSDLGQGRASVGYTVTPSARCRGVARKALHALTTFAWTIPQIYRIELCVEPWNTASIRVADAVGYQREGLLRSHQPIGDHRADVLLYAIVRADLAV